MKIKLFIVPILLFLFGFTLHCKENRKDYLTIELLNKIDTYNNFIKNLKLSKDEKDRSLSHLEDSYKRMQNNSRNKPLTKAIQKYVAKHKIKLMIKTQLGYHGINDNYLFSNERETVRFTLESDKVSIMKVKLTHNELIGLLEKYKSSELKTIQCKDSFNLLSVFVTVFSNGCTNQFAILNPQWFKYRDKDSINDYNKNMNHIETAKLALEI